MKKRGFTLIAAIFVILIFSLFTLVTQSFISSEAVVAVRNFEALKAFYISNAGYEYFISRLKNTVDWSTLSGETKIFSGGVLTITPSSEAPNQVRFLVAASLTVGSRNYTRTIQATVHKADLNSIAQSNVIYSAGPVSFGNDAVVSGEVGSQEASKLTLNTSYYDSQIKIAQISPNYSGSQTFSGALAPGSYYVDGSVSLGSLSLTGAATIVATGTITTNNNITIGNNFSVIAAGLISIGNKVAIGTDGLWYSSSGLSVGNQGETGDVIVGGGTVFLSPGDVTFGNTCEFAGFIYSGGTVSFGNNLDFHGLLAADQVLIGNNASLSGGNLLDYNSILGLEFTSPANLAVIGWQEIY